MEAVKPTLDRKAADQMNLNVLKRMDPDIEELISTAGHVALYDFDIATQKWSRKDVEGSLFVVKRRAQPRFRFLILNKKADGVHIEDLVDGFNCEMQGEYILYRSATHNEQGILGIWFYEKALAPQIYALLQKIVSTFAAPSSASIGGGSEQQQPAAAVAQPAPQQPKATKKKQKQQQAAATSSSRTTVIASGPDDDEETVGGDDFWDKKVKVPEELPAPTQRAAAVSGGNVATSAFANGSGGALGDDNALARVFAGMKVATAQQQQPAPEAPAMPLLTPQFLQQQQQQQQAGAALLEGLRAGSINLSSVSAGQPQQQKHPISPTIGSSQVPLQLTTAESETSDAVKVSGMLRALAGNEAFCGIVAGEMRRAGLL